MRARTLLLLLCLAPASARAATATVKAAEGPARIGKPGAWRSAAAGMPIAESEFLSLELGAHATVVLGDGSERVLTGRTVISGKRLAQPGSTVLLSDAVRNQTYARLDADAHASTEAATRGAGTAERLGKKRRAVTFMGQEEEDARAARTPADFSEACLRLADPMGATDYAWDSIANPDAPPVERARAHLVLGRIAVDEADFDDARREFDLAARAADAPAPLASATRAEALLQRGQTRLQLADDDGARADFDAALALAPEGATAAHAQFFLGVLALAHDDAAGARAHFDALAAFPELASAAAELLKTAP
ncbi:MAG TPA: hypothetical protein VMV18_12980 [bacterium]|nr:hypothetical protein [bacterium]